MTKNVENSTMPMFTIYEIFDFYDGATSGIVSISDSQKFYLFDIIAWDIPSQLKVFSLIYLNQSWFVKIQKALKQSNPIEVFKIKKKYLEQYSEEVILVRSQNIDTLEMNLIKINNLKPTIYTDFEKIANQTEKENQRWFEFFRS